MVNGMSVEQAGSAAPAFRRAELLDYSAVFITVGLIMLIIAGTIQPLRLLFTVAFTFFVPGRAIVSNWPRVARWSAIGMPIAFSLGSLTLIATVALWLGFWHPMELFALEALASLTGLGAGITRRRWSSLKEMAKAMARSEKDDIPGPGFDTRIDNPDYRHQNVDARNGPPTYGTRNFDRPDFRDRELTGGNWNDDPTRRREPEDFQNYHREPGDTRRQIPGPHRESPSDPRRYR
jgi:hypothetical protein